MRLALIDAYTAKIKRTKVHILVSGKTRTVHADSDYEPQTLVLIPLSPILGISTTGKIPANAVEVLTPSSCDSLKIYVAPKCDTSKPQPGVKQFVAPYWCVRGSDAQFANMELMTMSVELQTTTSKKNIVEIDIPCLVNDKKVSQGDELVKKCASDFVPKKSVAMASPVQMRPAPEDEPQPKKGRI